MSYTIIKNISRRFGLYRQARWFNRNFLHREELRREKKDLAFYSNFIMKGDLVFDVGANYGEKTRIFLELDAKVIAFEPQPDCRKELKARCGNNRNLNISELALGSKTEKRVFHVRADRGESGFLEDWNVGIESTIEASIVTLDEMIVKYGKPLYIKIDVEGFEFEVLRGLSQPITHISLEYHLSKKGDVAKTIACIDYLSNFGRLLINITPAENLVFACHDWMVKEEFLELFPNKISSWKGFIYGDIFVKTET